MGKRNRRVWGTDVKRYTIVHRLAYEKKCYTFGYYTDNIDMLREMAIEEASEGKYRCVKIINADTNEDFEYFTKAHR